MKCLTCHKTNCKLANSFFPKKKYSSDLLLASPINFITDFIDTLKKNFVELDIIYIS